MVIVRVHWTVLVPEQQLVVGMFLQYAQSQVLVDESLVVQEQEVKLISLRVAEPMAVVLGVLPHAVADAPVVWVQ